MKYLLKPIGPNGEVFEFDTSDIFHLSKLGRSDEGVVYFDDVPYTIESKPGYKSAPDLLAVAEMTVEWINEPGKGRTNIYPKLHRISRELTAAIAAAKGDK